eukprot:TRINITY_DN1079_c0_g1_i8.p1 TRINITY_DN1079_c0_g1~~TRINITY_DN1079_c0_g1_i8.p1  ORF type:complete len:361 (+),score=45.40 TRINITY_DN1079_c0_g1_i8:115-1197(+)
MKEGAMGLLASRIVDYTYLSKVRGYELNTPEKIEGVLQKVERLLINKLKQETPKNLDTDLYERISVSSNITFCLKNHVIYDRNDIINIEPWKQLNFIPHCAKARFVKCKQKCARCKTVNEVTKDYLDNNAITQLCEAALDSLCGKEKVHIFLIVGRYCDYTEIIKLYRKYEGNIYLAGFKEDALKNEKGEECANFISLEDFNAYGKDGEEIIMKLDPVLEDKMVLPVNNNNKSIIQNREDNKSARAIDKLVTVHDQLIQKNHSAEQYEDKPSSNYITTPEISPIPDEEFNKGNVKLCCLCGDNVEGEGEFNYILSCKDLSHTICVMSFVNGKYIYNFCNICKKPIHSSDRRKCFLILKGL